MKYAIIILVIIFIIIIIINVVSERIEKKSESRAFLEYKKNAQSYFDDKEDLIRKVKENNGPSEDLDMVEIQISINSTSELIESLKRRIKRENPPPDIEELILMNICILQDLNDQLQSLIDPERIIAEW